LYREELKKTLAGDKEVTASTKWDEISVKYEDNRAWNELPEIDRVQ